MIDSIQPDSALSGQRSAWLNAGPVSIQLDSERPGQIFSWLNVVFDSIQLYSELSFPNVDLTQCWLFLLYQNSAICYCSLYFYDVFKRTHFVLNK